MNFVSLFAGVGGFDLGFERAGMDSVGQVEVDAKCRDVLHEHWSNVPKWSDIKEVDGGWFGADVDVLVGGFPCQDYSVAGKRGGLAGDRGALWWQFHRLIDECRPRWVVGENVPGLLSSNGGRDFGTIVGSLVDLGYGVCWRVLDAQYFGVAQRRRRVFIVGHSGGIPRPEVLAFAEGVSGDSPPSREAGKDVAPTLGSRSKGGGGLGTDTELDGALIAGTLETRASWERQRYEENHLFAFNCQSGGDVRHSAREGYTDAIHASQTPAVFNPYRTMTGPGEYVEGFKPDQIHDALTANRPPKGPPVVIQGTAIGRGDEAGPNGKGWTDDGSTFTLDTVAPHGVAQAASVRRLTPLECERLQGFPDDWTASQSDAQRYRQMGNAVAVPVAEWIGKQLVKAE